MIELRPWEDLASYAVFRDLDLHDLMEAEAVRGQMVTHVGLWADWRAVRGAHVAGFVAHADGEPFAVGGLMHSGQGGVAEAALLARHHRRWRRQLAELALLLRQDLPGFCAARGIRRIEARAWADHPTASRLLIALGFRPEADLPGFGATGRHVFRQFALVLPAAACPPSPAAKET